MPYFAITQRVISKHHHSLKCHKLRPLQQGLSFETHVISKCLYLLRKDISYKCMQLVKLRRVVMVEPMQPAKLIEKRGNRDVERERKNKGGMFLLGEHDNFVVVVKK